MKADFSLKSIFTKPDFAVAAIVLGVAALGMNLATDYLSLYFRKEAVPMRCSALDSADGIPTKVGKWVLISTDKPLDADIEHVLGTKQYVQRRYVDSTVVSPDLLQRLPVMTSDERDHAAAELMTQHPEAVIDMGIFYYTGAVDTVAHIPDRCYIADGFDIRNSDTQQDQVVGTLPDGSPRKLDFSFLSFEDISGRNRMPNNVGYLFHVDGHYTSSSMDVRRSLQNLFERYGYYAKVELRVMGSRDGASTAENQQLARGAMKDFLSALLPDVERIMPDWNALHAQPAKK